MSFFDRLFTRGNNGSKEDAKSRLKILLVHDQVDLTPNQMDAMKAEILDVIARALRDAGFTHAICLDADAQHDPADIPAFADAVRARPRAIVAGVPETSPCLNQ